MVRLLRFFFYLLYNPFAIFYDLVSWSVSLGQWRAWQRTALPYLRGTHILELAHGTGDLLIDLTAAGYAPIGVDFSRAMGRVARRKLKRRGLLTPLVRANSQALPFPKAYFSSVAATFPAEFIGAPMTVAELYRVLAPGGVFVCVPTAVITGGRVGDRFTRWLFRITHQAPTQDDWYAPLVKRYTDGGFRARVENVTLPRSVVMVLIAEKPIQEKS